MAWQGRQNQWQQPQKQWQWHTQQSTAAPAQWAAPQAGGAAGFAVSGSYVFACEGPDSSEVVVKTLIGEYVENGSNHGRKVYKKVAEGAESVEVNMYYWDGRDGPAFQGWWLGNELGGTQVWSHNAAETYEPPVNGWKIPWDGPERRSVTVSPKKGGAQGYAQAPTPMSMPDVADQISKATLFAKEALHKVASMAGDYSDLEALQRAEQHLVPQVSKLKEALKASMQGQRGGDAGKQLASVLHQLTTVQSQVNAELTKLKQAKMKAELVSQRMETEMKDMAALKALLPEADQKCQVAEDCVDKALITSEVIKAASNDMDQVKIAVDETERAVQEAQKALGAARIFVNAKMASCKRFQNDMARERAAEALGQLQSQLQQAHDKLFPLKTVRQDYRNRVAAQKAADQVLEMLTPAEVDVDRAEEAALLVAAMGTDQGVKEAGQAWSKASASLQAVRNFIESQKRAAPGAMAKQEMQVLEDRVMQSQARLVELKNQQKEKSERKVAYEMMQEAADKLQVVKDAVMQAADAEAPLLMGLEDIEAEDSTAAIKASETAASVARMFIATKLVEAKRFSCKEPREEALSKLKEYQEGIDSLAVKLQELKTRNQARVNKAILKEAEVEVCKAEEATGQLKEAAAMFETDEEVFRLSAEELSKKTEDVGQAESVANKVLAAARKLITARQIEAKGAKLVDPEHTSKLIKFQARLGTAQVEVGKCKKLVGSVDQRLAARKIVQDATTRLESAEEAIGRLTEMVKTIGEDPPAEDLAVKETTNGAAEGGEASVKADTEADGKPDAETGEKPAADANSKPEKPAPEGFEEVKKKVEKAASDATTALRNATRYIEQQSRTAGAVKEISQLQPRVHKAQALLDAVKEDMKERIEKFTVTAMLKECEDRVVSAEEAVNRVKEVEATLAGENMSVEEATKTIAEIDKVLDSAISIVSGAKTLLAMKRLAVKRLSEAFRDQTAEPLAGFQTRLDQVTDLLTQARQALPERKLALIQKEVAGIIGNVEKEVEAAEEATKGSSEVESMTAEEMKDVCGKVGVTHAAAEKAVRAVLQLLETRRKAVRAISGSAELSAQLLSDISEQIAKAGQLQATVDKQKESLRVHEHRFVAHRLKKDAVGIVDKLEETLKTTTEIVAPVLEPGSENGAIGSFTIVVFMQAIFGMLKQHAKTVSKTPAELFGEIAEKSSTITESQFVTYVTKLMEKQDDKDLVFSDERQKAVFKSILDEGAEQLTENAFVSQFSTRFVVQTLVTMTDTLAVKGGKTVRKLVPGEIVEALEEPAKEESVDVMRVKARAETDGKEGFITIAGNKGTFYLEAYSPNAAKQKRIEKALEDLLTAVNEALAYIEKKVAELRSVRSGPLAETRNELQKMKPRVLKVQSAHSEMVKSVASALAAVSQALENEKRERAEAAKKKQAAEALEEVTTRMDSLQAEFDNVAPGAEEVAKSLGPDVEDPAASIDKALVDLDAVVASAEKTHALIESKIKLCAGSAKGPMLELRSALVKRKVAARSLESKLKKHAVALRDARKKFATDSHEAVGNLLKEHARGSGTSPAELFKALSKDGADVSFEAAKSFLSGLEGAKALKKAQLDLGLERYAAGLTKLSLFEMLQDFQVCVKDIAVTTDLEVIGGKTIKKIVEGDVVELLGETQLVGSLPRAQCRLLHDGTEGWVTLKGNQGSTFLSKCGKPYYSFEEEVPMQAAFESSSEEGTRKFKEGEVVEVLEGPRKEPPVEVQRVRGKAKKDGKSGWVTLKSAAGDEHLEHAKMLVCTQSVALTSTFDILQGKAIRKLEVGEMLTPIEEKVDEQKKLARVHVTSTKDGSEGWVTIKGNQGTSYVEATEKMYVCKRGQPLESRVSSGSSSVRDLEEGEVFEVTDGPKTEIQQGPARVKGRSMTDGTEGWFSVLPKTVLPWSPEYNCVSSTTLHDGLSVDSSAALRKLEKGELLQAISTPVLDEASGLLRIRVCAKKDAKTGFATLRGNQGTVFLESLGAPSSAAKQADVTQKPEASAAATKNPSAGRR